MRKLPADGAITRVMIVDDHPVFRNGLAALVQRQPELTVVAEVADSIDAMRTLRRISVDVAIIDVTLEGASGLSLVKQARAEWPDLQVLVLSMHDEWIYAPRAFHADAHGYVMKDRPAGEIVAAVKRVATRQYAFSEAITRSLLRTGGRTDETGVMNLSDRELEVFGLLGRGLRIRDVSGRLCISPKTVESHVAAIKRKLDIAHSNELVYRATVWSALMSDQR